MPRYHIVPARAGEVILQLGNAQLLVARLAALPLQHVLLNHVAGVGRVVEAHGDQHLQEVARVLAQQLVAVVVGVLSGCRSASGVHLDSAIDGVVVVAHLRPLNKLCHN